MNTAGDSSSSAAASTSASGGATSTGASGTAATDGSVTAESLSDPDLGYTIVSIPDDLDATQTRIVQDFGEYDKATWRLWFSGGKDTSEIQGLATGETLDHLVTTANDMKQNGLHANPPVRVSVSSVQVDPGNQEATVTFCSDQTQMTIVDAQGNDVTNSADKSSTVVSMNMVIDPELQGKWLANKESRDYDSGSCTVEGN